METVNVVSLEGKHYVIQNEMTAECLYDLFSSLVPVTEVYSGKDQYRVKSSDDTAKLSVHVVSKKDVEGLTMDISKETDF